MRTKNRFIGQLINMLTALALPFVVFLLFSLLSGGRMFNMRTVVTTLRQSVQPAIICYGVMLGMSIGMMNFACGAIVTCSAICGSGISNSLGLGLPGFIIISMIISLLCSAINGFLYNKLRVPCMVLGMGVLMVYEAFPRIIFPSGAKMNTVDGFLARQPYCFFVMIAMMLLFYILYNKTAYGHNIRAIGANQAIAVSAGLDLDRIKFTNFMVSGVFLGVGAVLYLSTNGSVDNMSALESMSVMMDGFMGVFLGMLLARFVDMSLAIYLGVLTMKFISNGFVSLGLSATWKDVVTGFFLLIVLAVSANAMLPEIRRADREYAHAADEEYAKMAE